MYPIDAIKVRVPGSPPIDHQMTLTRQRSQTRMQIVNPTPSAVYNGMIQGTYRIATGEGIMSLWRGMSSVVVGAGMPGSPAALCLLPLLLSIATDLWKDLHMPSILPHTRPLSISWGATGLAYIILWRRQQAEHAQPLPAMRS